MPLHKNKFHLGYLHVIYKNILFQLEMATRKMRKSIITISIKRILLFCNSSFFYNSKKLINVEWLCNNVAKPIVMIICHYWIIGIA